MAKFTLFFIFLVLGNSFFGCRKNPGALKGWHASIEKMGSMSTFSDRTRGSKNYRIPSAISKTICLKDQTLEKIRAEIKSLENSWTGPLSKGFWGPLSLEKLPVAQTTFIKKYGKLIPVANINVEGCTDLLCVLEALYNLPGHSQLESSLYHYYWFLKTGYGINGEAKIPEISFDSGKTYRDNLFSSAELKAFWVLSHVLNSNFKFMPSLQEIYRLPVRNYIPKFGEATCGISTGNSTSGYIRLMDPCLLLKDKDPTRIDSDFFALVTHEITHRLDYSFAAANGDVSSLQAWLNLSGWYVSESVSPTTGNIERQWKIDPTGDGFVRTYAATSPKEDFADTVGHFRFDPDNTYNKSPKKYEYLRNKIFEGRHFTNEGLTTYYENVLSKKIENESLSMIQYCLSQTGDLFTTVSWDEPWKEAIAKRVREELNIDFNVSSSARSCIKQEVAKKFIDSIGSLRENEWEACNFFDKYGVLLASNVLNRVNANLRKALESQSVFAERLQAQKKLRNTILEEIDDREAFVVCAAELDPRVCFNESLEVTFNVLAEPLKLGLGDWFEIERSFFKESYSFERAQEKINIFYSTLLSGIEKLLSAQSLKLWNSCLLDNKNIEYQTPVPPLIVPFDGGTNFVSGSLLNCLNSQIPALLEKTLNMHINKYGLSLAEGPIIEYVISNFLQNPTLQNLLNYTKDAASLEKVKLGNYQNLLATQFYGEILRTESNWMTNPDIKTFDPAMTCRGSMLDSAKKSLNRPDIYFFSLSEVEIDAANGACDTWSKGPSVQKKLKDISNEGLAKFVAEYYAIAAKNCIKGFSSKSSLVQKGQRRTCLSDGKIWNLLSAQAKLDLIKAPLNKVIKRSENDINYEMRIQKTKWQSAAVDAMENSF